MRNVRLDGNNYPCLEGLDQYITDCKKAICCWKRRIQYPSMDAYDWPEEDIKAALRPQLRHIKGRGNVYAFFKCLGSDFKIVYIGTRKKCNIEGRMKEHLVSKSSTTSSKLECVKSLIWNRSDLAISYILVEPENLRFFVEQELIEQLDPLWNKRRG